MVVDSGTALVLCDYIWLDLDCALPMGHDGPHSWFPPSGSDREAAADWIDWLFYRRSLLDDLY